MLRAAELAPPRYGYVSAQVVPLADLLFKLGVEVVDLLILDCETCEYGLLDSQAWRNGLAERVVEVAGELHCMPNVSGACHGERPRAERSC